MPTGDPRCPLGPDPVARCVCTSSAHRIEFLRGDPNAEMACQDLVAGSQKSIKGFDWPFAESSGLEALVVARRCGSKLCGPDSVQKALTSNRFPGNNQMASSTFLSDLAAGICQKQAQGIVCLATVKPRWLWISGNLQAMAARTSWFLERSDAQFPQKKRAHDIARSQEPTALWPLVIRLVTNAGGRDEGSSCAGH